MSGVPWNSLSKRVQDSIELQGPRLETDRACGCHECNGKWWLCQYHEGFQDADAINADEIDRLTNALAEEQAANSIADMAIERLTAELAEAWRQVDIARGWAIEQRDAAWDGRKVRKFESPPWEEQS